MQKYRIYTEIKKFYITNNVVTYSIFGMLIILGYLKHLFFENANLDFFEVLNVPILKWIFLIIAILIIVSPIFLKLHFNWNTNQPLKGIIDGDLELYETKIVINNKQYLIDEIKNIDIWNFDFEGEIYDPIARSNFNGLKSNGIENSFEIMLLNNEVVKVNFQQDYGNQIIHAKKELFSYYANGKIELTILERIFNCKDQIDKKIFRETLPPTRVKSNR